MTAEAPAWRTMVPAVPAAGTDVALAVVRSGGEMTALPLVKASYRAWSGMAWSCWLGPRWLV